MTEPSQSLEPAFAVEPHLVDPSGAIAVWWTEPPGALLQFRYASRGTTAMAEWLAGPGLELLVQRFPGRTDLRVILDMRQMTGRSAMARSVLMQSGKEARGKIAHVVLLPSVLLGSAYVKVVEGAALVLRLAGLRCDVEHALDRVLCANGVRAAEDPRSAPLPLLGALRPVHPESVPNP